MPSLNQLIDDLVTANRILAENNVLDSFGHISVRHPANAGHFFMARARAPMCVDVDDIMEFTLGQLDGLNHWLGHEGSP